jgi:hypothetical protein
MNNMYGRPADPAGPGPAGLPDPNEQHAPARDRRGRMIRWGTGVTLAGFLAGGGIALAVLGGSNPAAAPSGGSSPAAVVSAGSSPASAGSGASRSGQAEGVTLNAALNTASSTSSTVPLPRLRAALARLRALGGVDGEFTFHNSTGYHTLAFERGSIQSVSGSDVVVRAPDGTIWTWLIVSDTVVRQDGGKTSAGALVSGQAVFVGGPVINGAKDARLIVIRSSGTSPSSSVSGPSGTSVS